ncbi:unnamed protein product, partial [Meganyctiphanes norvegica]
MLSSIVCLLLSIVGVALGACPNGISPCTCKEVTEGRVMDCTKVQDSAALTNVFQTDMDNADFDYFEIVPMDGTCSLEALPANVFGGKTFNWFWIGRSNIATVDAAAFDDFELKFGQFSEKSLQFIWSAPLWSRILKKIKTYGERIQDVSKALQDQKESPVILHYGQVSSITEGAFTQLPHLAHLELSGNPLTELQDNWLQADTDEPWVAYLDGCSISQVSSSAFSGSLPSGIFLNNNQLTALPQDTFGPLVEHMAAADAAGILAHVVDVTENPLVCDCSFKWFAQDQAMERFIRGAVCSNDEVAGTPVFELPSDFFDGCR